MPPSNHRDSLLELCPRATDLANSVSTRMVEYLAISKSQSHGLRELAIAFLETCQTLWPIQAGLLNSTHQDSQLPSEVVLELKGKISQTIEDFSSLDLLLSKFLIYEKKKGFSKFSKGLGLMFVDSDIHRLTESLTKNRDALRMGSLAFQWVLGDSTSYASMGNAYASLATVLRIANSPKPPPPPPEKHDAVKEVPKLPEVTSLSDWAEVKREPSTVVTEVARISPPISRASARPQQHLSAATLIEYDRGPSPEGLRVPRPLPSPQTSLSLKRQTPAAQEYSQFHFTPPLHADRFSDSASQATAESLLNLEDMLRSHDYDRSARVPGTMGSRTAVRLDPSKLVNDVHPETMRAALVNAVQMRNHKTVEELLDLGVSPDSVTDVNLLRQAILNADAATIRLLLLFGANANGANDDGVTPLMSAIDTGSLDSAKALLKYGADVNLASGPDDEVPLAFAAARNRTELVELFLTHGANSNAIMPNSNTPFVRAIHKTAPIEMVEIMLKYGANPNGKNGEGKTPFFEAISIRRLDLITLLLDHGANPNLAAPKHCLWPSTYQPAALQLLIERGADVKKTPGIMELAVSINSIEAVSILLKAGVSPNVKKDGVYTPLCSAIRDDHPDIVTLLLASGADPNLPASEYPTFKCITHDHFYFLPQLVKAGADLNTPPGILETAVAFHHREALNYLLEQGVNPNDSNTDGYTPLTTAIRDDLEEFVQVLLKHGASPTVRGQDWPLSMAVKRPKILKMLLPHVPSNYKVKGIIENAVVADQLESIKLLVEAGFSVEDKTGGVFSPLTTALRERREDIAKYLLDEAGADPNAPGEHLPIVKAIRRCRGANDTSAIEMLLERSADINLVYRGWNAVMQAIETGDPAILRLLIEKGNPVDLDVMDDNGKTVRCIAQERGWKEGAKMLLGSEA